MYVKLLPTPKLMELPFRGYGTARPLQLVAAEAIATLLALASARDFEERLHELLG